jgi:hypothetical protein
MKNLNLKLILLCFIFLNSCTSEYDANMNEFKKCVKAKKAEKKYKYANMQEALNAYDFEVARDYLACYPDKWQEKISDRQAEDLSNGWEGTLGIYEKDLLKIVQAEIVYFIGEGEFQKAEATAKEANLIYLYNKLSSEGFEKKLDELIEKKEYKKIISFLSQKKAKLEVKYDLEYPPSGSINPVYNNTARSFNSYLENILLKYKLENTSMDQMNLVIMLSMPELVPKPWRQVMHSELKEIYKIEATAKYLK